MRTENGMNEREIRGYSILAKGDKPQIIDGNTYYVPSQSGKGKYKVNNSPQGWVCECPDFQGRKSFCKHIHAVRFWLGMRDKIYQKVQIIPESTKSDFCPHCHSSNIIKRGIRKNEYNTKQRFSCNSCGRNFVLDHFKKFKGDAKTITLVMDLYFKGISLRKIQDHLKQFYGMKVCHATLYNWINHFMKVMNDYTNQLTPQLSGTWHADEQFVKVRTGEEGAKGNITYCWNVMDSKTRFLIASKLTQYRGKQEAHEIMKMARQNANIEPSKIITDKLPHYGKAIANSMPNTEHHRYLGFRAHTQNNKIERFHNTFRARDKTMRGLKSVKTAHDYAKSFQTYYNFIRPHMGLNGLTPAQIAGIVLPIEQNRWLGLLRESDNER